MAENPLRIVSQEPLPGVHPDKRLFKCTTHDNKVLVKKEWVTEGEARMQHHASQLGLKTPPCRGITVEGKKTSFFVDFVYGDTVAKVWKQLKTKDQKLILKDLQMEIEKMRKNTKPTIGRVDWNQVIATNDPYQDPYYPDNNVHTVTSFRSEADFDRHKIGLIRGWAGDKAARKVEDSVQSLKKEYTIDFVLTHADLHQDNILVHRVLDAQNKPSWRLACILDWARSGYYPRYMEYATAMLEGPIDPYWRKEMKEVLEKYKCSSKRLEFEKKATYWSV